MPETPLSAIKMSPQARAALAGEGILTLEAAAAMTDAELTAIKGFKDSSLARLRAWEKDPGAPESPGEPREVESLRRELYVLAIARGDKPAVAKRAAAEGVAAYYEEAGE